MIVWLASYPRSGNTFLRVILHKVFNLKTYSIHNDPIDISANRETSDIVGHQCLPDDFSFESARQSKDVYPIKTHLLPENNDDPVVYLLRDGRASLLSYAHYKKNYGNENNISASLEKLIVGKDLYGGWGEHVRAWNPQQRPHTLFVRFEDMISGPETIVEKITDFLGVPRSGQDIPNFAQLNRINDKMFREGKVDSWKSVFTDGQQLSFWLQNYREMMKYGYIDGAPELLEDELNRAMLLTLQQRGQFDPEAFVSRMMDQNQAMNKVLGLINSSAQRWRSFEANLRILDPLLPNVISDLVELNNVKSTEIVEKTENISETERKLAESQEVVRRTQARFEASQKLLSNTQSESKKSQEALAAAEVELAEKSSMLKLTEAQRDQTQADLVEARWKEQETQNELESLRKLVDEKEKEVSQGKMIYQKLKEFNQKNREEMEDLKLKHRNSVQDDRQIRKLINEVARHRLATSPRKKIKAYRRLLQQLE